MAFARFRGLKPRLGHPMLEGGFAAVGAVHERMDDDAALMVDYQPRVPLDEAMARGRALDSETICALEEPIRHDADAGAATSPPPANSKCRRVYFRE